MTGSEFQIYTVEIKAWKNCVLFVSGYFVHKWMAHSDIGCHTDTWNGMSGSVAEWSKALVLGTSLFGGVGSNPTAAKSLFWSFNKSVAGNRTSTWGILFGMQVIYLVGIIDCSMQ